MDIAVPTDIVGQGIVQLCSFNLLLWVSDYTPGGNDEIVWTKPKEDTCTQTKLGRRRGEMNEMPSNFDLEERSFQTL